MADSKISPLATLPVAKQYVAAYKKKLQSWMEIGDMKWVYSMVLETSLIHSDALEASERMTCPKVGAVMALEIMSVGLTVVQGAGPHPWYSEKKLSRHEQEKKTLMCGLSKGPISIIRKQLSFLGAVEGNPGDWVTKNILDPFEALWNVEEVPDLIRDFRRELRSEWDLEGNAAQMKELAEKNLENTKAYLENEINGEVYALEEQAKKATNALKRKKKEQKKAQDKMKKWEEELREMRSSGASGGGPNAKRVKK